MASENDEKFDYIIVGAGSAGCVLAARLSEKADTRVLLLEAGGWDRDPLIHIPIGIGKIGIGGGGAAYDWGYRTEPEPFAMNRKIEARRGKLVGGCSSINVMAYVRGQPGDYDRWAAKGAHGWSYAEVLPYFKRNETFEAGETYWRGGSGPLGVTFAKTPDPLFPALIEAGRRSGFPVTDDYNGEHAEGFGRSQMTIRGGYRSSSATAFLRPALCRGNLVVRTRSFALRILFSGMRAIGIEYRRKGETMRALANCEIILSGGVFNSPQLLMVSGIGDTYHLKEFGIASRMHLPGVGQNLQDHPAVTLRWSRRSPGPFHAQMRADRMLKNLLRGYFFGSGPATYLPGGTFAFIKTRPDLDLPDIQYLFPASPADVHMWFPGITAPYKDGFGIRPCLLRPESRGSLRLRSADPQDRLRIFQRFFSVQDDLVTMREACKIARRISQQPSLSSYREEELVPGENVATDAALEQWIRQTVTTSSHPCATCAMGNTDAAVLDEAMKVRGIDSLRVVDASAMPDIVSGNLNACVLMMAEKASDMILGRPPLGAIKGSGQPDVAGRHRTTVRGI